MKTLLTLFIFLLASLFPANIEFLTSENFYEKTDVYGVVIVEFWAAWNNENAYKIEELTGADLYRVDIESERSLTNEFEIKSIPTIIIFKDGEERYFETAGITFKNKTDLNELQDIINLLNNE